MGQTYITVAPQIFQKLKLNESLTCFKNGWIHQASIFSLFHILNVMLAKTVPNNKDYKIQSNKK